MFIYEIVRLIIIAIIMVYFFGSFTYLVSDKLNSHVHGEELDD